jgi:hypothetical protein
MLKGSCLCGAINYEYLGSINDVVICHCDQCKRAQGTPFVTNAPLSLDKFAFTKGTEVLKEFLSSPNKRRVFCGNCGSPFYSQRLDMPETIRLRLGTITEGHIPPPSYEIYCDSKAQWFQAELSAPPASSAAPALSSPKAELPKYAQNKI